ncbi:hypothetical protein [Paraburkholderia kururiensis]|uniref:Uncharacterized protein n=1 Tax=Paraburkholderia kururiensis TaxID=984307 RepID=A0ABZ0WQ28_9BURK|nr:hypothetical protein [Paraburkholderia kururiensis]WQD79477.1 hypothetical protein U0042_07225 [Paraburkholderia kururiensis]
MHLIPMNSSYVLDVGAGIGTDAAAFAAMEHTVVAVEPVDAFRVAGIAQHRSHRIEWLDERGDLASRVCQRVCSMRVFT